MTGVVGERRLAAPRRARLRRGLTTFAFAVPMLVVFGVFAWWPMIRTGVLAVQRDNLIDPARFIGLDNFRFVLDDPLFWTAVRNTVKFTLMALVFGYPIPLTLAIAMNEVRRGKGLYSALAYLPVVVPPVAAILLWRVFFDASPDGVFNTVLGWVGLGPYPWIQDPSWSMPSVVLLATWSAAGATVIIYLAALTRVPAELYEAAEVDGAGTFAKLWHVTLPQLRGVMFVTLILQLIGTFQVFTEPFLLTDGGPANSTMTIMLLIYRYAFGAGGGGNYGAAAALSLMLAAFLAIFSAIYFRLTRPWATT